MIKIDTVIRRRREQQNLTQSDLATMVGVDVRQIRRYESAGSDPPFSKLQLIADALGLPLAELLGEPNETALDGRWFACWQNFRDDWTEIPPQLVDMNVRVRGEKVSFQGPSPFRGIPGYWKGDLALWDGDLTGYYETDNPTRASKGSLYFVPSAPSWIGRWVGLSHNGPLSTGLVALAREGSEARKVLDLENRRFLLQQERLRDDYRAILRMTRESMNPGANQDPSSRPA